MSLIFDFLNTRHNGCLVETIAKQFLSPVSQTREAMTEVVDDLAYQIDRNTLSRGGLADLIFAIGDGHHIAYVDDPTLLSNDSLIRDGKAILEHITGSKHASRSLAARAAKISGLDATKVEDMLPVFAALTMGGLAKQTRQPLFDVMQQFSGDKHTRSSTTHHGALSEPDVGQHEPLPVPGDHIPGLGEKSEPNPFEDFSDVIRDGRTPNPAGGGSLWHIIRSILSAALGFRSNSILGWIIQFIIYRWGWRILSSILRHLFLGR